MSRNFWATPARVSLLASLVLSSSLLFQGCRSYPTRKEVEAAIWNVNFPLPAEVCGPKLDPKECTTDSKSPWCYGFYRVLNAGGFEFISLCQPEATQMNGIWGPQLKNILDKYLPEKPQEPRQGN